ncbi:hypothetical protein B296_00001712 [Ensete ventricosum]|uniref:Uncharacterized protein n=1 Tax=Ensete ventricosum TaxID=4639 RepID=A0A427B4W5_ENSVE|nr:hypothetical protein B296_00001712 [Ensete ventricosum]
MGITCTAFSESLARCTSFLPMSEWGSYEGRPSGSSNDLGAAFSAAPAAAGRRCSSDIVEALDDRNILVTDADLYWGKEKNSPPILVPPGVGSEEIRRIFDARREGIRGETGWTWMLTWADNLEARTWSRSVTQDGRKKPAARRRCGGGYASPTPGDPFSGSHKASAAVPALRNRPSAAASEVRGNHKGEKRSDGGKGKPTGHGRVERSCACADLVYSSLIWLQGKKRFDMDAPAGPFWHQG